MDELKAGIVTLYAPWFILYAMFDYWELYEIVADEQGLITYRVNVMVFVNVVLKAYLPINEIVYVYEAMVKSAE